MAIQQAGAPPDTESVGTVFTRMPLNKRHLMAGFALFFAFVIEAWEMLILSYIATDVEAELNVGDTAIGFLISA
ncbi:MAG: MFS transporter, partial [Stackebrandtia sp.]